MPQDIILKNGKVLNLREMPEGHKIEYLANSLEGECFYLVYAPHITEETVDKFPDYYGSFGLYVGTPDEMREADVEEVFRWRDGGTTQINYVLENEKGQLYFPSPRNKGTVASDILDGEVVKLKLLVEGIDF